MSDFVGLLCGSASTSTNLKEPVKLHCGLIAMNTYAMMPSEARDALGMPDPKWAPVALKRDVEYPEILDGVVDSLKQIADVLHEVRPNRPDP